MSCEEDKLPPHVLIFPLPALGHLNSMLNLAHLFCLADLHVTFVVSEFSHCRLLQHSTVPAAFARYPGFQLRALPDGLPDDHPRAGESVMEIIPAVTNIMAASFKKMMIEEDFLASAGRRRRVTCFVADGIFTFAADFSEENGISLIYFRTHPASYFWSLFCYPELVEAQEIPFGENSMDELVKSIPGIEGFLRRRDLPSFFRADDANDTVLKNLATSTRVAVRAQAAIFNTCEDLEGPILDQIQKQMPRIYSIGPTHEQLKSRLTEKEAAGAALIPTATLWPEDRSCIEWLNSQPRRSVLYVSFGSITVVKREQLLELWHGLVNSCQRFLWVMRPDSISGGDGVVDGLMEGSKEKGMLVEWAPQEVVLSHPAVGGFLTHSGWNSTLESIAAGVPMICWPYFADQMLVSRFVSEVWKIGLDMKDSCDRLIVENALREVMDVRKEEFLKRAGEMATLVKKSVSKGGSSYSNLDSLIDYVKSLLN